MEDETLANEPLLEPAEGARPEDEERYQQDERRLAEEPLDEPAEGARSDPNA